MCTGVILVGLALSFGASNLVIGILAAIPYFAQLFQIPAILLVERYRRRRKISVLASGIGRTLIFGIAITPFLSDQSAALIAILSIVAIRLAFAAVSNCSWNSWIRDVIPEGTTGAFFSRRMLLSTSAAALVSLSAGAFIDIWAEVLPDNKVGAYTLLLSAGGVVGLVSVWLLAKTPEPPMQPATGKAHLWDLLMEPVKDRNFRRMIGFIASWEFAVNLAAPFFAVYMLKRLGYTMSLVMVFVVLSQFANVLVLGIWGKISDKFSNKSILSVCGPLFIVCIFGWTFVTFPHEHFLTIPLLVLLHVLMGISSAGVSLATNNIGIKLAPRGKATSYLAMRAVIVSVAAGLASIIGGLTVDLFDSMQLSFSIRWESAGREIVIPALIFKHWDFFFVAAAIVGLYSLHKLSFVDEDGEVEERVVVEELISQTRSAMSHLSTSTAAGMLAMTGFPFIMICDRLRRRQRK